MSQVTIVAQSGGGGGSVDSVNAGTNIVITGTSTDPIVNLSNNPNVAGTVTAQDFKLPATTSGNAQGTLFLNNNRFLYSYPDATSVFLGSMAGNALNSGSNNTAIGYQSLENIDAGTNNTALGFQAGFAIDEGQNCVVIGSLATVSAVANGCIVIGKSAGFNNQSVATKNIYIGNGGTNGETLITRIGDDQTHCYLAGLVDSNFGFNFPNTTANFVSGFISQNGIPIFHNYGNNGTLDQIFIGQDSGNASAPDNTGNGTVCIGTSAMQNLTGGISSCTVVGNYAYQQSIGSNAVIMGYLAANGCPDATGSVILGYSAAFGPTNCTNSVIMGINALSSSSGNLNNNIAIGASVASSWNSNESNNIVLGSAGISGDQNVIRIGTQGSQQTCFIAGIADTFDTSGTLLSIVGVSDGVGQLTEIDLIAGSNITLTPASGSITISAASLLTWAEVTSDTSMLPNHGYVVNSSSLTTLTLPTTAAQFTEIKIIGKGTGGWKVAQNTGQTIYFGTFTSTTGTSGTLSSTSQRDTVTIRCITANTEWQVEDGPQGNLTVA